MDEKNIVKETNENEIYYKRLFKITKELSPKGYFRLLINLSKNEEEKTFGEIALISPYKNYVMKDYRSAKSELVDILEINIKKEVFITLCNSISKDLYLKILNNENSINSIKFFLKKFDVEYIYQKIERIDDLNSSEKLTSLRLLTICCLTSISETSLPNPLPNWLTEFLRKIDSPTYYSRPIKDLYKLAPYSQPQLNYLLKKYLKTTLVSYMNNIRIEYACSLLATNKDDTVMRISEEAGYYSLSNFNHVFKKIKKISPSQFRKQIVNK